MGVLHKTGKVCNDAADDDGQVQMQEIRREAKEADIRSEREKSSEVSSEK